MALSDYILELQERRQAAVPPPAKLNGHHSNGYSPADVVRERLDWDTYMIKWGWTCTARKANETWWKRPGKTDQGHSAVLHESGALVIFSTEIPSELAALSTPTRDGSGSSVSLYDFICAYEHGGDRRAMARWVRDQPWGGGRESGKAIAETSGLPLSPEESGRAGPQEPDRTAFLPTLADTFWSARPWLAQVRQAAHAKGMPADAVLVNVLALYATTIPVTYLIPALLGSPASLNFVGCVVAPSGGGKTQSFRIAEELVGSPIKGVRFGASPGSGEGIIQAYIDDVEEEQENGKTKPVKRQVMSGIHFYVDEGTGLSNSAKREGTTILQTICSAWSGERLGQENAQSATWRRLERDAYRFAVTICVQRELAHEYFTQHMQSLGVTGRGLWASAIDPSIPEVAPEPVGPLDLPLWGDRGFSSAVLTFPERISPMLYAQQRGVNRGEVSLDPFQSQHKLLQAKIAALFALAGGSMTVTESDWELAGMLLRTSQQLMAQLSNEHRTRLSTERKASGIARAEADLAGTDWKEAQAIAALSDRIVVRVLTSPDNAPVSRREIKKLINSRTRHRLEPALARAMADGRISFDGVHYGVPR